MTELDRLRVRLLRSNFALKENPAIARWLRECFVSIWVGDHAVKRNQWCEENRAHVVTRIAVIYIRDDGWSLAALKTGIRAAEQTWFQKWIYVAEAPDFAAIPYQTWVSRRTLPTDWTARDSFWDCVVTVATLCRGCLQERPAGTQMKRTRYYTRGGAEKSLLVCDDDCWATWNHAYWFGKAQRRECLIKHGFVNQRVKAQAGYPVRGGGRA